MSEQKGHKIMTTKETVLQILNQKMGEAVSGEELARTIGVSRASIWKSVKALRDEGYNIGAKQNSGYVLSPSNVLSATIIGKYLNDKNLEDRISIYPEVTSTNNVAKKYAAECGCSNPIERVFIADKQTAGRGRQGRSFYSPPGSGVYMSFLLCPRVGAYEAARFTTAASVAVCVAIEKAFGLKPDIKWVNDVFFNNKKICGILTEAVTDFETGGVESVVIGIGVNMFTGKFPKELRGVVGSLGTDEKKFDRNRLIAEIINCMTDLIEITDDKKIIIKDYIDEYKKRSRVLGKTIKILNTGETAEAIDINKNGGLVVKTSDGVKTLQSGEISIRLK